MALLFSGSVALLRAYDCMEQQAVVACIARDPLGAERQLEGSKDSLGHYTFVFEAAVPGKP